MICSHNDRIWLIEIYVDVVWMIHMDFRFCLAQNSYVELANKEHH